MAEANGGQTRKAHMADAADLQGTGRDFGLSGKRLDHAAVQIASRFACRCVKNPFHVRAIQVK